MSPFKRTIAAPDLFSNLDALLHDYEVMLATIMRTILERHERDPNYPFIDTKLSIITGKDFPQQADEARDFKGKTAIFGWIQGRGLEALAQHARWVSQCTALTPAERSELAARLSKATETVFQKMEQIRADNHGRIAFLMTPDGHPFDIDENGRRRRRNLQADQIRTSDVFYAKGMFAAAAHLRLKDKIDEAKAYFRTALKAISSGDCATDQISFDPKNKVGPVPGKFSHGFRMLALGGIALVGAECPEDEWLSIGEEYIRHVNERYINRGRYPGLAEFDFYESTDASGTPWKENGRILSDPGHALEYIGFASKTLLLMREKGLTPSRKQLLEECRTLFPEVLIQNFRNGYNPTVGGICKAFDLLSRQPINSDMPWWNLPETLRAAAELLVLYPESPRRQEILEVIRACSNGFMRSFVNADVALMAYQTVNTDGKPVDVVPATPDADPGYHTGLSIIDFLACMRKLQKH